MKTGLLVPSTNPDLLPEVDFLPLHLYVLGSVMAVGYRKLNFDNMCTSDLSLYASKTCMVSARTSFYLTFHHHTSHLKCASPPFTPSLFPSYSLGLLLPFCSNERAVAAGLSVLCVNPSFQLEDHLEHKHPELFQDLIKHSWCLRVTFALIQTCTRMHTHTHIFFFFGI